MEIVIVAYTALQ